MNINIKEMEILTNINDELEAMKDGMKLIASLIKRYNHLKGYSNIDLTVERFINTECIKENKLSIKYSELFAAYQQSCIANDQEPKVSKIFSNTLTNLGYLPERRQNCRVRTGLTLKTIYENNRI